MKKPSKIFDLTELPAQQDNKWWIENSTRIDDSCQGLFETFFKTNEVPVSKMPDYTCVPIQCKVLKNHRFRFVIVRDDDGVLHLCILKYVEPPQHQKYFVLSYEILPSVKGVSTKNVEARLAKAGVVKGVVVSDSDPFNFNFYNTKEEARNMTTSKWRSKHGINKLKDVVEVKTSVDEYKDGLHALIEKWGRRRLAVPPRPVTQCLTNHHLTSCFIASMLSMARLWDMQRLRSSVDIFSSWFKSTLVSLGRSMTSS